jgi:hypothetical protein
MKYLLTILFTISGTLAQPNSGNIIIIGIDKSASTLFEGSPGNVAWGIRHTIEALKRLDPQSNDLITIKGFGEYQDRLNKSGIIYEIKVRGKINYQEIENAMNETFSSTAASQQSTEIVAFLENLPLSDPGKKVSAVILLSDAIESSGYGNMNDFIAGRKLPTDGLDDMNGASLQFIGFASEKGNQLKPNEAKLLKLLWKEFSKAGGITWIRPITQ